MRIGASFLLHFALAPLLLGATPRVVFERVLPASHGLGAARNIAIVKAPAGPFVEEFVSQLLDHTNRSGLLQVRDGRAGPPPEVGLEVVTLKCDTATHEVERSVRDLDGNRLRKQLFSIEAACVARIDVLGRGGKRVTSFFARGQGTSPNRESVTNDLKDDALKVAIRFAAASAAERITPRRVRETILLDEKSPAFGEALAMIEAGRLAEARRTLEAQLPTHPRSAPLRFNLGAIYEALGDRVSAGKHYTAAKVLAPDDARYAAELKRFALRGE